MRRAPLVPAEKGSVHLFLQAPYLAIFPNLLTANRSKAKSFPWHTCLLLLLASLVSEGCAVQYYDKATQTEHLWGVGHFKMKAAPPNEGVQATVKGVEVLGASIKFGDDDTHLMVGWNKTSQLAVVSEGASVRLEWPNSDMFSVRVGSLPPFLSDGKGIDSNITPAKKGEKQ
jgi:hypothetical protein